MSLDLSWLVQDNTTYLLSLIFEYTELELPSSYYLVYFVTKPTTMWSGEINKIQMISVHSKETKHRRNFVYRSMKNIYN